VTNGRTVSWHQAEPANLVLISGPESYFASRASRLIKDKLRANNEGLEVNEVAEGEYSPGLIFSLASPSLFNEPRLVIIGSASEGLAEDLEQLLLLWKQQASLLGYRHEKLDGAEINFPS